MARVVDAPTGSILAIAAHPDDIESWCGGTLALAAGRGATVRLLLATSGDKGSSDPLARPGDVARGREAETREAARRLGLAAVEFLRHPDGELEDTRAFRGELVAWLRRWRPEAVFTFDPERPVPPYLAHRDHRVVGRATLDAVYPAARDPLSFPEHRLLGLSPHNVRSVWLFASDTADRYVDISTSIDQKIDARLAHVSQTVDPDALRDGWRSRFAAVGAEAGLPFAEAFTCLDID